MKAFEMSTGETVRVGVKWTREQLIQHDRMKSVRLSYRDVPQTFIGMNLQRRLADKSIPNFFSNFPFSNHQNGGGWVHHRAKIAPTVYVGPGVVVFEGVEANDDVVLWGRCELGGQICLRDDARVGGRVVIDRMQDVMNDENPIVIEGHAQVFDNAMVTGEMFWMSGFSQLYGDAVVNGKGVIVSDLAQVCGYAKVCMEGIVLNHRAMVTERL